MRYVLITLSVLVCTAGHSDDQPSSGQEEQSRRRRILIRELRSEIRTVEIAAARTRIAAMQRQMGLEEAVSSNLLLIAKRHAHQLADKTSDELLSFIKRKVERKFPTLPQTVSINGRRVPLSAPPIIETAAFGVQITRHWGGLWLSGPGGGNLLDYPKGAHATQNPLWEKALSEVPREKRERFRNWVRRRRTRAIATVMLGGLITQLHLSAEQEEPIREWLIANLQINKLKARGPFGAGAIWSVAWTHENILPQVDMPAGLLTEAQQQQWRILRRSDSADQW